MSRKQVTIVVRNGKTKRNKDGNLEIRKKNNKFHTGQKYC